MRDKVKVILRDGDIVTLDEWQKIYALPVDSDKIGHFFDLSEARFLKDIELYDELIVCEPLMVILDGLRQATGRPVHINSFNRDEAHQADLKKRGFKTAAVSPHVVKMAADVDTQSVLQTHEWVKVIQQVASAVEIKVRIGYQQYLKAGQTFIHVDVCPEYYAYGKPWHSHDHPPQWELSITW